MVTFLGLQTRSKLYQDDCLNVLPTLESASYDLVLTSPPYFDLEVYSQEATQSVKRFPTWQQWVDGFLEPMIRECLRCLKPEGVSAWSVKNMKKNKLQDEVFKIHEKYGWHHTETFGMTATPRNTGQKAKITEETFIFKKR
jgi:DNA modification methylase